MKGFYIICTIIFCFSCNNNRGEKLKSAREDADYIMENFDSENIIKKFPEKYFPLEQTKQILSDIKNNCNWAEREGGFKDYIETYSNGKLKVSVIYEYKTDCGEMELIMIYLFPNEKLELYEVKIN